MATNNYFNSLLDNREQSLMSDLVAESISIYGMNVTYIVRDTEKFDDLLREEKLSVFRNTYIIDAFMSNQDTSGMQKYMSKFGFKFEDNTEIIISKQSWDMLSTGFIQPREGDYIYLGQPDDQYGSFVNAMYVINNVWDNQEDTAQFGNIVSYKLVLSSANKSYSNIMETNYNDINDFLNADNKEEMKTAINDISEDFANDFEIPKKKNYKNWGIQ